MTLQYLKIELFHVVATIVAFLLTLALNHWLFARLEFVPGINWVYLPAGVRLLATLLFAEAGAVGLLIVSWAVSFFIFFPGSFGGILASLAPYLVYRGARRWHFLDEGLVGLTAGKLLVLSLVYAIASPLLHHLWFAFRGQDDLVRGFLVMFAGDLTGTLIVLYAIKGVALLLHRR
jgi:hypothetical protein